jgi:hypothetical protein
MSQISEISDKIDKRKREFLKHGVSDHTQDTNLLLMGIYEQLEDQNFNLIRLRDAIERF